ncbi:hypothetical protein [Nocardia carnea]|uniref:hypothetical protein n=1 Tax=Nocardia carnea TaxID=37328 RepID=UPI0024554267|nr:hypothetical protein [Nocardia carnea]
MEITVVVVGPDGGPPGALRSAFERLVDTEWSGVLVQRSVAGQVSTSEVLGVPAEVVETVLLDPLIAGNPGGHVLVLCDSASARALTAQVLEVRTAVAPLPESGSITRFRASQTGVRSVLCVNDTLHLAAAAARCTLREDQLTE